MLEIRVFDYAWSSRPPHLHLYIEEQVQAFTVLPLGFTLERNRVMDKTVKSLVAILAVRWHETVSFHHSRWLLSEHSCDDNRGESTGS